MLTSRFPALVLTAALAGPFWHTTIQSPPATTLSPADIAQAIKDGTSGKKNQATCYALPAVEPRGETHAPTEMDIGVEGPVGRIMRAAHAASAAHRSFTPEDVTPALAAPTLLMYAGIKTFSADRAPTVSPGLTTFSVAMAGAPVPVLEPQRFSLPPFFEDSQIGVQTQLLFDLTAVQANPKADLQVAGTDGRWVWRCSIDASAKMKLR